MTTANALRDPEGRYAVSERPALDVLPAVHDYIIAVDGKAVTRRGSNGSTFFMTYRTARGADVALSRVLPELRDAKVVTRDG